MRCIIIIIAALILISGCDNLMEYEGLSPFHVGDYIYPEQDAATKQYMKQVGHGNSPGRSEGYCGMCHWITDRW